MGKQVIRNLTAFYKNHPIKDNDGRSALHVAVISKNHSIVPFLLSPNHVDINLEDNDGKTALAIALENGYDMLVYTILQTVGKQVSEMESKRCFVIALEKMHFYFVWVFALVITDDEFIRNVLRGHLKEKKFSILWHACKDGHIDCIKSIMKVYPELIYENGPDGTSPLFVAFSKGHQNVIDLLREEFHIDFYYQETQITETESFMIKLTEKFPVFNDKIEAKLKFTIPKRLPLEYLSKYSLGNLCLFNPFADSFKHIVYIQDTFSTFCRASCKM